jgi:hypothetical protein
VQQQLQQPYLQHLLLLLLGRLWVASAVVWLQMQQQQQQQAALALVVVLLLMLLCRLGCVWWCVLGLQLASSLRHTTVDMRCGC